MGLILRSRNLESHCEFEVFFSFRNSSSVNLITMAIFSKISRVSDWREKPADQEAKRSGGGLAAESATAVQKISFENQ